MKLLPILLLAACGGSEMLSDSGGTIDLRPGTVVDPRGAVTPGTIVISSADGGSVRRVLADGTFADASLFDAVASADVHHAFTPERLVLERDVRAPLDVDVAAKLALAPAVELQFALDAAGLAELDVAVRGSFEVQLDSLLVLAGGGGWDGVETVASQPTRAKAVIDHVPVIATTRFITDLAVYAGGPGTPTLASHATAQVELDARAHYDRATGWTVTDDSSRMVIASASGEMTAANARVHVNAVATVRLEIALYDQPTAHLDLRATSSAEAAQCVALGEASVGGAIGVTADVLYPGAVMPPRSLFRQVAPTVGEMQCR